MNGPELTIYDGLLGALLAIVTIMALRRYLEYRYLCREAKSLEKECRQAVYLSSPDIYSRNCGADESRFICSSLEVFQSEYDGRSRRRILITMSFARPDDRFSVEPVVRECTLEKVNSAKNRNLFVHLYTTLSTE